MQITRRGEYALRTIYDLSVHSKNGAVFSKDIAARQGIPPKYIAQIVLDLSRAGFVTTARGTRGGVKLAKAPSEISLLDVLQAIDGPITLNVCLAKEGECEFKEECPMHRVWRKVQEDMVSTLANTTFGDLAESARRIRSMREEIID